METHTPMHSADSNNTSIFGRIGRWLVRPGDGTLRHTHETARAVRRRLNLSPRQYKKRLKAAKRSGLSRYLQPFLRREVAPPVVTRQPVKRRGR